MPIKPIDSIKSKVLLATIVPAVIMIPIMLISLLLFKIDIVSTLLIGVDTMLMVVGINCLNVLFDMKKAINIGKTCPNCETQVAETIIK